MFDYSDYQVVKDTNTFSKEKLNDPDFYLWPGFFWVLNDRLDKQTIYEQIKDMYDHGAKSLCFFSEPLELGKDITCDSFLDNLKYLDKEYMEYFEYIAEVCKEFGMHLWLYDEAAWPSGTGGGQVYARDPKGFEKKELTYDDFTIGLEEESYKVPEDVLYAAVQRDGKWDKTKPGETLVYQENDSFVRVFYVKTNHNDQWKSPHTYDINFANLLNKEAMEAFVKMAHERIKGHLGDYFGQNIFFTFTDEPGVSKVTSKSIPWVQDFDDYFQTHYGYSLVEHAPELLNEEQPDEVLEVKKLRVDLFDCLSKLFTERYLKTVQDWCHDNNILSSGHLWQDGTVTAYDCGGVFHMLRELRALDVPGIDYIFREYFPGNTPVYAKYASSIARQKGVKYTMTESFCLAGNGITLGQMKGGLDQQYVRGCNLLVMGCYPYSTREHLMSGERPHYGPVNPYWKYQDIFHEYTARLSYLMSRGSASGNVAVYFNMRDIWAGVKTRQQAFALHDQIYRNLFKNQIDFDFIDDDVLAGLEGTVKDGKLIVGAMEYDTIVVPESEWMDEQAMEGLVAFAKQGGKVLVVGQKLECAGGTGSALESDQVIYTACENISEHLKPVAALSPNQSNIRMTKRELDELKIYFIFNESGSRIGKTQIKFDETADAVYSDIENGIFIDPQAQQSGQQTTIDMSFEPWESKIVLFGSGEVGEQPDVFVASTDKIDLIQGWKLRPVKQYKVGLHDFEINEIENSPWIDVQGPLKEWNRQLGNYFSGEVEYTIDFDCPEDFVGREVQLDLGAVHYACEAWVNGQSLGRKAWGPFVYPINSKLVKAGKNQINVKVTNTLANAILSPEAESIWDSKKDRHRIKGRMWDNETKNLEKDSVKSGMLGPVKVVFGS